MITNKLMSFRDLAAQFIWLIILALFKARCLTFCALLVRAQVFDGLFFTIIDV